MVNEQTIKAETEKTFSAASCVPVGASHPAVHRASAADSVSTIKLIS